MTRDHSTGEVSGLSVQTTPNVGANIRKMAKCMALKTNHIGTPALRLEALTRSDLVRLKLLRWSSKLVPIRKEPSKRTSLPPLPSRLGVGFLRLIHARLSVLNRLVDPLRGTDRLITPGYGVTSKMLFSLYTVLVAEEQAEALLINRPKPIKAHISRVEIGIVLKDVLKLRQRGDIKG